MARIDIRVSDFEKEELCRLAGAAGVTVTDFIRQRCLGGGGSVKAGGIVKSTEFRFMQAPFEKPMVEPPPPLEEKVVKKPGPLCFACRRTIRVGMLLPEKCEECGR